MATEIKSKGHRIETHISPATNKKLMKKVKAANTSRAQLVRDLIQQYVKG